MEIVYPHRLTFLERGRCNVCGEPGKELIHTSSDYYFGWESCLSEDCRAVIQSWYINITIPLQNLRDKYGEWIYIKRTNGFLESGWEFLSDAHQEEKNGPYWVKVTHKRQRKIKDIQLSDIERFNQSQN